MTHEANAQDFQAHLAPHAHFVQRLAAALVGPGAEAEDLAQDAMVAAAGAPTTRSLEPPAFRAWLRTTVRRAAIAGRRSRSARQAREAAIARCESTATAPPDLVLHRETIALLSAAVLGLPDPYQATILSTYYEGLSASETAKRMGVSVATVRSRLQRGRAMLRERLERDYGGRPERLSLALAPLVAAADRSRSIQAVAAGAPGPGVGSLTILMGSKWVLAVAALVALIWVTTLLPLGGTPGGAEPWRIPPGSTQDHRNDGAANGDVVHVDAPSLTRSPALGSAAEPGEDPAQPQTPARVDPAIATPSPEGLSGRVLYEGAPVPGATVCLALPWLCRLPDANGIFSAGTGPRTAALDVIRKNYMWRSTAHAPADRRLDLDPPSELLVGSLGSATASSTVTDASGVFRFDAIPERPFLLSVRHDARGLALRDQPRMPTSGPTQSVGDLELVPGATVLGQIQMDHTDLAAGQTIALSGWYGYEVAVDSSGQFAMRNVPPGPYLLETWQREGVLFAGSQARSWFLRVRPGESRTLSLQVPTVRCAVVGVTVTAGGQPLANGTAGFSPAEGGSIRVQLDEHGKGRATVPAYAPLRAILFEGRDEVTLATEVVFDEGTADVAYDVGIGAARLTAPRSTIPSTETCEVTFTTNDSSIDAVRFDQITGRDGVVVPLDAMGEAKVVVPAWTLLRPSTRSVEGQWAFLDTHRADFSPGEASFDMHYDPEEKAYRITSEHADYSVDRRPHGLECRLVLRWTSASTGEPESATSTLNMLEFLSRGSGAASFDFESLPLGKKDFEAVLETRRGGSFRRQRSWLLRLAVERERILEVALPE